MLGPISIFKQLANQRAKILSLLFFFLLLALWSLKNFQVLSFYPEPSGTDGYFYLKQILSLSRFKQFYFQDHSLAFWLPVGINNFLNNELLAYQVSIVVTMSLIGLALAFLIGIARSREKSPSAQALLFFSLVTGVVSFFSNYFLYELGYNYLKTSVGLMLFLWGMVCWESEFWKRRELPDHRFFSTFQLLGIVLFLLSILAHKTTFVLIGLYVLVQLQWKKVYFYLLLGLAVFGWNFATFFYPTGKQYLLFILNQQITDPAQFISWIQWLISEKNWLCTGPLLVLFGLLSAFFLPGIRAKRISLFTVFLGALAWNPFFVQNVDAPTYRLAIIHWAITPTLLISLWMGSRSRWWRALAVLLSALMVLAFKTGPSIHGFFKGYSKLDLEVTQLIEFVKPGEHLTCHHGLEFYVDFKTPIRCRSFISNHNDQKKWRVVWAPLQRGSWSQARILLNAESPLRLGRDYFLMPEERWVEIVSQYHLRLNWKNPMGHRPDHIYE